MPLPLDLSVKLTSDDGTSETFHEQADGERVAQHIEWSTRYGTGHENGGALLARDSLKEYATPRLWQDFQVIAADGGVRYRGRLEDKARTAGEGHGLSAIGYWAALKDLPAAEPLYIDQDISHWGEPPLARRVTLATASQKWGDPFSVSNEGGGLVFTCSPGAPLKQNTILEVFYTAPAGATVAKLVYNGTDLNFSAFEAAKVWTSETGDNPFGGPDTLTLDTTERTRVLTTPDRVAMLRAYFTAAATTTADVASLRRYEKLEVHGNHGLTTITASEVIKNEIDRACPDLTYDSDSIEDTTFEIAQLVFDENARPQDVVARVNAFHLWDVAVWGRKMHFGSPLSLTSGEYEWELSIARGDGYKDAGESATEDYGFNGVWVYYEDIDNGKRLERVGPLGTGAGQDSEGAAQLLDDRTDNPLNAENKKRYATFKFQHPIDRAGAIAFGTAFLSERRKAPDAGEGSVKGYVRNRAGVEVPAHTIRSGDRVKYTHENKIRRVHATSYSTSDHTVRLTYGNPGSSVEAMVERLGVSLINIS